MYKIQTRYAHIIIMHNVFREYCDDFTDFNTFSNFFLRDLLYCFKFFLFYDRSRGEVSFPLLLAHF